MSVLGELDLLGPRAHGAACGEAVLKAVAEDFQVDEVLEIPLSGEGEHLWLWVEKRGLNTEEAARRLGRAAGVQQKNVSYAGLKDRQALTRQWFSLHLPGKADPDLGAAEGADLRILRCTRHSRKLQRGAHAANGFTLRLTGLRAERAPLDARLERIAADGVPNYFGLQRFGHGGGNLVDARSCAEQDLLPANRNLRSRFLSAGRSYLFNRLLAERVAEGSWNRAAVGDLLAFTDSRSFSSLARKNAAMPVWPPSTCTPPDRSGARAIRRAAPASSTASWPWPGASRRSAAGWRRRAWRTNGASCGSPSRGWRGIIPNLMFCNWNSSCRPVVSPP